MIKIKNSSTNEYFHIDINKQLTIYNCGPTLYNHIHIGNLRPLIVFDIFYRYLLRIGCNVKYVHNLTDIDDKIINRAEELHKAELEITNFYHKEYLKIFDELNVKKMDIMPKVSDNITGIIEMIEKIVDNGFAYVSNGDVYFKTNMIKDYGSVSGQNIDNLISGARVASNEDKASPLDFALWKSTKKGIGWKTKWNEHGRPGWHSECVFLINKYIGKQVSIHGGGVDLKFPHHENENAQNIALNGIPLAKCWMHVGHLNVNNQKMSKSLNNFILVKDNLKEYSGNAIRWFLISTNYEKPINYSSKILDSFTNEIYLLFSNLNLGIITLHNAKKGFELENNLDFALPKEFIEALDDNLNTPNAISVVWNCVKCISKLIKEKQYQELITKLKEILSMIDVLGLKYSNPLSDESILVLVNKWNSAIKLGDYKKADELREVLKKKKII